MPDEPLSPQGRADQGREARILVSALWRALAESGYARVTFEQVRAYTDPADLFSERFASLHQALDFAHASYLDRLQREAAEICAEASVEWPLRVKAGLSATVAGVLEAEGLARALLVEAGGHNLAAAERQLRTQDSLAAMLAAGRRRHPGTADYPVLLERVLVGGVSSLIEQCLVAEDPQRLRAAVPDLVEWMLTPYVGARRARWVARG